MHRLFLGLISQLDGQQNFGWRAGGVARYIIFY